MPITPTYPGVYVEEIASGVRTIVPVSPSVTAFVGGAKRGIADYPVRIQSEADFARQFGGLSPKYPMSYAISHFFQHGGADALVVRVTRQDAVKATVNANGLPLEVVSAGAWGNKIRIRIDHATKDRLTEQLLFNLFVYDGESQDTEEFRNVSTNPENARYVKDILEDESVLIRIQEGETVPGDRPGAHGDFNAGNWFDDANSGVHATATDGTDGANDGKVSDQDIRGPVGADKRGINALLKTSTYFSMLCLPPASFDGDLEKETYNAAIAFVEEPLNHKRALVLVDAPSNWDSVSTAANQIANFRSDIGVSNRAALFFPLVKMRDPLKEGRLKEFTPSGAIAGIMARTDLQRGIWKAPAGIEARFRGVDEFTVEMNDAENGRLNPLAVNCLRNFPAYGKVVWGSRTMEGFDEFGSEWKYVPVRRFALFLEENLYRGTQWVVFEPNDEPLWAQIRLNIGTFMQDLFRQGAFQGASPQEAYFVRCDSTTTTQSDINRGIVNIEVGFAPLKPAEFVILKIQQIQKNS